MQILAKPAVILMIFLGYKVLWLFSFTGGGGAPGGSITLRVIFLIGWAALAWLAFQGKKRAQWVLGLLIFLHLFLLVQGLFFIPMAQAFLKVSSIIFGAYFAFGGIVMINHSKGAGSKFLITTDNIKSGFTKT